MRKLCLALSMLIGCIGLYALSSLTGIRAEDYQAVVCRLVLDLDTDAEFWVQQKADGLLIEIQNFDGKDAKRFISSSMIREIQILPQGIWVSTIPGLRYEKMRLPLTKQAVIDLFSHPSSQKGRLAIARFYSDRGKYASADEAFYALQRDFPDNDAILFHWGILLKRRGSSRANDKLQQVSPESEYYESAVDLLRGGKYLPPVPESSKPSTVDTLREAALRDSIYQVDSLIVAAPHSALQEPKPKIWDVLTDLACRHFFITLGIFVSVIVILSILIFGPKRKKAASPPELQIGIEAQTLRPMVNRLLADGWTHKEIARELKISSSEVAQIANQSYKDQADDQ